MVEWKHELEESEAMVVATIEISCVEVWREISNYIDGEIDPALRQRMQEHFKICEHCTAILDGTRNVVRIIADRHSFEIPAGFSERLKRRLHGHIENPE
jgi:hypothetical protein